MALPSRTRAAFDKRDLAGALISLVSVAAVILWALHQDTPRFPTAAGDLALVVAAVGIYAVATLVRGWRWHVILRSAGIEHRAVDAYLLTPVGYMGNTVLPARGGEVLRVALMAEHSPARWRELVGSLIGERLCDLLALTLLLAVLTWTSVGGTPAGQAPAEAALGLVVAVAVVTTLYLRVRRNGRLERFATAIRPFAQPSRFLLGRMGGVLVMVSAGTWMLEAFICSLVGRSLGLDIAPFEGLLLVVLSSFMALLPALPGYVGTYDAGLLFGLGALGVHGGQAVAFVLLVRFVLFVPITAVGLVLLLTRYGGLRPISFVKRLKKRSPVVPEPPPERAALSA